MKIKIICVLLLILVTLQVVIAQEDYVDTTIQQPSDEVDIIDMGEEKHVANVGGDEYGFVTNIDTRATITIDNNVYHTNARVSVMELLEVTELSDYRCGVSKSDKIVCEVRSYDGSDEIRSVDPTLVCWGNNELKGCPSEEIENSRGGGAGKVSISDIKIGSRSLGDGPESSIEVYYQGVLTQSTDPDDDSLELSYVWSVSDKPKSSSVEPSESVSLSFTKIEMKFLVDDNDDGLGASILVEFPEMRVHSNSLIFTTIFLGDWAVKDNDQYCGKAAHLLTGGDCDDSDPEVHPGSVADGNNVSDSWYPDADADGFGNYVDLNSDDDGMPDFRDPDDDGDRILTSDEPTRGSVHRDIALRRAFITDTTGSMGGTLNAMQKTRPTEWSKEDREDIGEYIKSLSTLEREDFALAVAYQASNNERIKEVIYNNETNRVEVIHTQEVRLLGFIKMNLQAKTVLDDQGFEVTEYPWWAMLASGKKGYDYYRAQSNHSAEGITKNDENPLAVDEMEWVESASQ